MPATFTVDAFTGEHFRGKVRQIRNAPTTLQNVVTYDAVIDVANPDLKLASGDDRQRHLHRGGEGRRVAGAERGDALPADAGDLHGAGDSRSGDRARRGRSPARRAPARPGRRRWSHAGGAAGARPGGPGTGGGRGRPGGRGDAPTDRRPSGCCATASRRRSRVRVGLSDGNLTELIEGDLHEGDALIVDAAATDGQPAAAAPAGPGGMRRLF